VFGLPELTPRTISSTIQRGMGPETKRIKLNGMLDPLHQQTCLAGNPSWASRHITRETTKSTPSTRTRQVGLIRRSIFRSTILPRITCLRIPVLWHLGIRRPALVPIIRPHLLTRSLVHHYWPMLKARVDLTQCLTLRALTHNHPLVIRHRP
jgi:hypothetical protein